MESIFQTCSRIGAKMTLLTYQVFQTAANIGSFHKAADILGLTPSAISHTISSMENELGFTVMTRSKSWGASAPVCQCSAKQR